MLIYINNSGELSINLVQGDIICGCKNIICKVDHRQAVHLTNYLKSLKGRDNVFKAH